MKNKIAIILTLGTIFLMNEVYAQKWERVVNLKGLWKFAIGDDKDRASVKYDDTDWEVISVPSSWEDEGFHGYDGYAWYRKRFNFPTDIKDQSVVLRLGRIDDVDEVFLNGYLIGKTGTFPPEYQTAYNSWREYYVPQKFLNAGSENVIAVRVYDSQMEGGMIEGDFGFYVDEKAIKLDYDLAGQWKFATGDDEKWKDPEFDDASWKEIFVPGFWESQGYFNYDGFAWYRLKFTHPANLAKKKLVLVLGKIDDIDEVYLNGQLIGSTGDMNEEPIEYKKHNEYQKTRGYFIPQSLLQAGKENVIAVRVYDGWRDGGIYLGPIGFVDQSKYTKYWREYKPPKQKKNFWELIFGWD
jgi:hypothetical protein